jgi:hypothetical protein
MITFLISIIMFSLGFVAGSFLRASTFDSLDWRCLKWNADSFGYRPVPDGTMLYRGDKVMMALPIDPGHWGEEGTVYGDEPS